MIPVSLRTALINVKKFIFKKNPRIEQISICSIRGLSGLSTYLK